jgi:hypothetical protein
MAGFLYYKRVRVVEKLTVLILVERKLFRLGKVDVRFDELVLCFKDFFRVSSKLSSDDSELGL